MTFPFQIAFGMVLSPCVVPCMVARPRIEWGRTCREGGDELDRDEILSRYRETRALSVELCRPLQPEDYRVQSMPDVSPPWWNLGHTSWFFAKNILEPFGR